MCNCNQHMTRVYMLASYAHGRKLFKEHFEYLVPSALAEKMVNDGQAEYASTEKGKYQNKMLKINYERN